MSSYAKFFLGSESMDHQLSNALSTMFLRHLVMFLHFDAYAFESAQKAMLCMITICQSGIFSQNVDFITSDEASYQNVRHGFGTPKGHVFSL